MIERGRVVARQRRIEEMLDPSGAGHYRRGMGPGPPSSGRALAPGPKGTMPTPELVELAGLSVRRVHYWIALGLLQPTKEAHGSGYEHRWTIADMIQARCLRMLIDGGHVPCRMRPAAELLWWNLPHERDELERFCKKMVLVGDGREVKLLAPWQVKHFAKGRPCWWALPLSSVLDRNWDRIMFAEVRRRLVATERLLKRPA